MSDTPLFDSVTVGNDPAEPGEAVAAYADGHFENLVAAIARFGGEVKIEVDVNDSGVGNCLDVENGDATPAEAPGWTARRRAAGINPVWNYCNQSSWPDVIAAHRAAGSNPAAVRWWIADYTGAPHLPVCDGITASACQYAGGITARFDSSCVAPGVFDAPVIIPTITEANRTMPDLNAPIVQVIPNAARTGYWLIGADGGVFAFDVWSPGPSNNVPTLKLSRPIVGGFASATEQGLLLVASDGGVFAIGDATFHGSIPALGFGPAA